MKKNLFTFVLLGIVYLATGSSLSKRTLDGPFPAPSCPGGAPPCAVEGGR
jgi:hypothetical protein